MTKTPGAAKMTPEDARLQYLDDASRAILATAPATSAYIQSTRISESNGSNTGIATKSNDCCNACGAILVPGWSCKVDTAMPHTRSTRTRKDRLAHAKADTRRIKCLRCNSTAKTPQRRSHRPQTMRKQREVTPANAASPPVMPRPPTASATTPAVSTTTATAVEGSTKKRSRNKKSSLHSLLAGQKPAASGAGKPGLDLMDFMKK